MEILKTFKKDSFTTMKLLKLIRNLKQSEVKKLIDARLKEFEEKNPTKKFSRNFVSVF